MIPIMLQKFLVDELKSLFDGFYLKNVKSEQSLINVYPQYLPAKKEAKDTAQFPHIRVILLDGENGKCRVLFIVGVWDDDSNYQGYWDVCNILHRIYDHLMRIKVFNQRYIVDGDDDEEPPKWSLAEDDYWPYFFGGIETTWSVGKITSADND